MHALQGNRPESSAALYVDMGLTRAPMQVGPLTCAPVHTLQGNRPESGAASYVDMPSDLRPVHTLPDIMPESSAPSYAVMPTPSEGLTPPG